MTAVVGLDVGTTGVKALALSPEGEVLATATRGYPLSTPRAGWAEQDPEDWGRAAKAALAELASSLRPLLELPVARVLVSHGDPVLRGGRAALEHALAT